MTGKIKLPHQTSGSMSIAAPATQPSGDLELKLPATIGTAGQVLQNSSTAGTLEFANAGKILQVVQGIKKDTASNSTGGGSWYETNITTSITPSNASNKIWLTGYVMCGIAGPQHNIGVGIYKAGSLITDYQGDAAGSRARIAVTGDNMPDGGYTNAMAVIHFNYLDTAGGTSAITYGIGVRNPSSITRTVKINYAESDADETYNYRGTSVITAMEVAV